MLSKREYLGTLAARLRRPRVLVAMGVAVALVGGGFAVNHVVDRLSRNYVVGYFDNSTGIFRGDDVWIRGVSVGKIDKIEPQPTRVKISFWYDRKYRVPADAMAAILSPQLVTGRAIQLTPPYTGGPTLHDGAVIPESRTVVPVEWDQIRDQLQRLTEALKPAKPGGVSTLGELLNTAAANLRGQGTDIRDTVVKLSQTMSALSDHSNDIFSTVRNLSTLVTALHDSSGLLEHLNTNLAAVSAVLADDPHKVTRAVEGLNSVVGDIRSFVADNREAIGTAADKLTSITDALVASLGDIKQFLHVVAPTAVNVSNIYEPSNGSLSAALQLNNFSNPIGFLCGAVQAASQLGAAQSAKLCAQYLAPILKNRSYNFPPIGENLIIGAQARPNEVTYSEDWMRPDFVPPAGPPPAGPPPAAPPPAGPPPAAAVNTDVANPAAGLPGLMVPSRRAGQ